MRAASLRHTITIERATETVNAYGVPVETWAPLVTLRADRDQTLDETRHESGTRSEITTTFTIRFIEGIRLSDRIMYLDEPHDITQLVEIGRRRGLTIVTMARPAQ